MSGDVELHLLSTRERRTDGEIRDEGRELGVVRLNGRRSLPGLAVIRLEQLLGLLVHQDDVGAVVGDENRIRDVFQNQVQAVALPLRLDLRQSDPLNLPLELVCGATQIGHVAQHRNGRASLGAFESTEIVGENFEQEVRALVRIHQIQLTRPGALVGTHRRFRQVRREQEIVDLHRATPAFGILVAGREQVLGALVLDDDVVLRVDDHDRIGKRVHDRGEHLALLVQATAGEPELLDGRHA